MRSCRIALWVCFLAIFPGSAPVTSAADIEAAFDVKSFTLEREAKGYSLRSDNRPKVPIPTEWLGPPEEVRAEADLRLSLVNLYDKQTTAFPIGDGRIGLHLSSYEIQNGDAGQTAAGRDVFLIFDPETTTLRHGGIRLGITKDRLRVDGRVSATAHTFFIGDINGDRLMDLGILKEQITWKKRLTGAGRNAYPDSAGPSYVQHPVRWYAMATDRWTLQPQYDGQFPHGDYLKLPLIGLVKSPVDFVNESIYPGIRRSSAR